MGFYGKGNESAMIEDALEASGMAWWLMELPSGAVFFSPNKIKMLGYTPKDASKFSHYSTFTNLLHPNDHAKTMNAMQDLLDGKIDIYEASYHIQTKAGEYIRLYDRGRIVAQKDEEVAVAGIVMDITHNYPLDVSARK